MKKQTPGSPRNIFSNVASDVQYELSRCFMNYAKDQLLQKQIQVMMESNVLIQTMQKNFSDKYNQSFEKDLYNLPTNSSMMDSFLTEQEELPTNRSRRTITRKTNSSYTQLRSKTSCTNDQINKSVQQVVRKCSTKSAQVIQKLLQNYLKLKNSSSQTKPTEQLNISLNNIMKLKSAQTERNTGNNNQMLNNKISALEKSNLELTGKIKQMQNKIWNLNMSITNQKKKVIQKQNQIYKLSAQIKDIKSQNFDMQTNARQFFEQEQARLSSYVNKMEQIHNKIVKSLQQKQIQEGCSRCCMLIRKIKDSLINYKNFLTQQTQNYKLLWKNIHILGSSAQVLKTQTQNSTQIKTNI